VCDICAQAQTEGFFAALTTTILLLVPSCTQTKQLQHWSQKLVTQESARDGTKEGWEKVKAQQ
jgi:hypothetical protein